MAAITLTSEPPAAHLVWEAADLPAGTQTLTVTRLLAGQEAVVRGASALYASGGAVLDDFEIPLTSPVSYTAEAFDSAGVSLGVLEPMVGQVRGEANFGWVMDPTNPGTAMKVGIERSFAGTLTRARQVQTYQVGNRTVALLGAMGKLSNVPLRLVTATAADCEALEQLLQRTAVLIRTAPPIRVPRLLYVVVPTVKELPQGSSGAVSIWDLEGDEIDATTLDILVPVVTWQDYKDAFPTWQAMKDAYTTWFDAKKNPPV